MKTFRVGDLVTWTSQSSGSTMTKTGRIVVVLGPDSDPLWNPECNPKKHAATARYGGGIPRNHESYVVLVEKGRRRILYWPRVSQLRLVEESRNREQEQ